MHFRVNQKVGNPIENLLMKLIVHVDNNERCSSASEDVVFETSPNLVELSVFDGKNYVNLSNKLISEGLGIEWNIFPKHNNILKGMDDARACGLLLAKKPFHCGVDERNLEKVPDHNFSAVEREHRVRLSITQPQITTKLCSGTANAPFFRSSHCALTQAPMALTRWNLEETPNSLKPLDPLIHQIHGSEVEATNEALKNSIQKAKGSNVNTQGQKKERLSGSRSIRMKESFVCQQALSRVILQTCWN